MDVLIDLNVKDCEVEEGSLLESINDLREYSNCPEQRNSQTQGLCSYLLPTAHEAPGWGWFRLKAASPSVSHRGKCFSLECYYILAIRAGSTTSQAQSAITATHGKTLCTVFNTARIQKGE